MIENDFYSQETMGPYEMYEVGDLILATHEETLRGCQLAYRTFGTLNEVKDNAVLVTTWFSGTGKVMEDVYVGTDHALDPEKYFIIIVDQIGSGLSTSPHNNPAPQSMGKFPNICISDDVRAQHMLVINKFGIDKLALIVGCSMGGQQVYEWCVRYPDMVERAAMIACTAKISLHQQNFTQTLEEALTFDPSWNGGWYDKGTDVRAGLDHMASILALLGWSCEFFQEERWRSTLGMSSRVDFMNGFMKATYEPMDPNALLVQIRKWGCADISLHTNGDLPAALSKIKAKTCVMPISHDLFFPPQEAKEDHKLIHNSLFRVIESKEGHFGVNGFEPKYMEQINRYLEELIVS